MYRVDFQAPKSLNTFRGEGGHSDVLCRRSSGQVGTGRSTSSYKACLFVASKLGLAPPSDIVVALRHWYDVLGMPAAETTAVQLISSHACLTEAILGGFLPSPYNIIFLSLMADEHIGLLSSEPFLSRRAPGKSTIIIAIRHGIRFALGARVIYPPS